MTTTAASASVHRRIRLHTLGLLTVWASVVGAVAAIVMTAWPDQVTDQHYSYPTPTGSRPNAPRSGAPHQPLTYQPLDMAGSPIRSVLRLLVG